MGDNRGPELIGVIIFFLAFSWIFVVLRCYCRAVLIKSFGLDDIFCLLAQVNLLPKASDHYLTDMLQILFTFFCGFSLTGVAYGAGQHMADIEPQSNIPIGLHVINPSLRTTMLES